jgi:very-short-patch-repair endonuclease
MDLDAWLDRHAGVVRRASLIRRGLAGTEINRRLRSGEWRLVFRGVIATHRAQGPARLVECRGALVLAGRGSYLSCLGAALHRGLPTPAGSGIHVSVPNTRAARPQPGFRAHRDARPVVPSEYAGLPAVTVEVALIGSFGCLDDQDARRDLVIRAVRDRLVSTQRVAAEVRPRTPRRDELLDLLAVCDGSQSEAEIAMLEGVIRAARLREPSRQHPVRAGARNYRIDLAYPDAMLAIEVDGKAWHFDAERRTVDIKRDAELAALGWLTLRFTYEQITTDAGWVARCVGEALERRTKITS